MLFFITLFSLSFPMVQPFTFFIPQKNHLTGYKVSKDYVIKISFTPGKSLSLVHPLLNKISSNLTGTLKLKYEDIEKGENVITEQLQELFTGLAKFNKTWAEYNRLIKVLPTISNSSFDEEYDLSFSDRFIRDSLLDISHYASLLRKNIRNKPYKKLLTDPNLQPALANIELLSESIFKLVREFKSWEISLRFAMQNFITKHVRSVIVPNADIIVDQESMKFLSSGIIGDTPIFYVQAKSKQYPYRYQILTSVQYMGFSLQDGFHLLSDTQTISRTISKTEIDIGLAQGITECLASLNSKNVEKIIENCPFVRRKEMYKITDTGILFQQCTANLIDSINSNFKRQLTCEKFPLHISFNKTFVFKDRNRNKISVRRHEPNEFTFSTLSQKEKKLVVEHIISLKKEQVSSFFSFIKSHFTEDYLDIILNTTAASIFFSLFYVIYKIIQYFLHKKKVKNPPILKTVTKRLQRKGTPKPRKRNQNAA